MINNGGDKKLSININDNNVPSVKTSTFKKIVPEMKWVITILWYIPSFLLFCSFLSVFLLLLSAILHFLSIYILISFLLLFINYLSFFSITLIGLLKYYCYIRFIKKIFVIFIKQFFSLFFFNLNLKFQF